MLKNITLTAEEQLIKAARGQAKKRHTTLNQEFRRWLELYARQAVVANDYKAFMAKLSYAAPGQKFSRDDMNER